MVVTILHYFLVATGILGIISALACFGFIFVKMKINHVIKKLLLFATIQQAIGYSTFLCSVILFTHFNGFNNKLICFLGMASIRASSYGTQASITAISIIRYSVRPKPLFWFRSDTETEPQIGRYFWPIP